MAGAALVENFEEVMAEVPNPQKKHLLHRLVKKVLVQDRRTVEVWYGLPNPQRFEDWNKWLPTPIGVSSLSATRNRVGVVDQSNLGFEYSEAGTSAGPSTAPLRFHCLRQVPAIEQLPAFNGEGENTEEAAARTNPRRTGCRVKSILLHPVDLIFGGLRCSR